MQAKKVQLKSYAKLNLALNVLGVENDYHMIDSIVTSISLYDSIFVRPRTDNEICLKMHGKNCEYIPLERNNAFNAAELFIQTFQTTGADIDIYKNIPVGAGLGGSSANCAAVLNALAIAYNIQDRTKLKEIADRLGSDTGFMLQGGLARLNGRGEKVQKTYMKGKLYFLLLFPKGGVNTAKCYKKYDSLPMQPLTDIDSLVQSLRKGALQQSTTYMRNALQAAAIAINKNIEYALQVLQGTEAAATLVTGSGSCVYGVFFSYQACREAQRHCRKLQSKIVTPVQYGFKEI